MKIDSDRLRTLRQRKKLSRPDLERVSGITVRTIQRLENEPDECKSTREDTVNRLARALEVEPGVLTGELPFPELDEAPASEPDPVRIGAQIAPKVRLAYDLIKRRYGVNLTDIINMAPLFFVLLAEGSLARRREELDVAKKHWEQIKSGHGVFGTALVVADNNADAEEESIDMNDIFGEHLLSDSNGMTDVAFDPSEDNPFADYLCNLSTDLRIPKVIQVDGGKLCIGSPAEFPDYNVWPQEIERISNCSSAAKRALETGFARLMEIPEELMAEDKDAERQQWLENRLAPIYMGPKMDVLARMTALSPTGDELRDVLKDVQPRTKTSETEEEGNNQ